MTQDPTYDVFLSHTHADAAWVEQLAGKLAANIPACEPMTPEPYVIVRPDPLHPGRYNVHAGARASVANPVYRVVLHHNGVKISEARTNLALVEIPNLAPGRHTFKVILPDGLTAETEITVP